MAIPYLWAADRAPKISYFEGKKAINCTSAEFL
jgi:hypothetical protein